MKWLGEIPSHWEIVKIKNICFPLKSGGTPQSGHDEFYSDEGTPWVAIGDMSNVDYLYKTTKCVTKKGINNKKLTVYPKGTLLYSIYATLGKVCTLCVPATINQAILAINVRNESYYQPYLKYYLKCIEPNLPSYSNSNTQSNLNAEIVNNLRVLSCPISEQKHIVSYLDSATSKIDDAIAQQQKMIDLLNERKQIIINNAVTKGLDPNVKMKPSGIDWIGDIPEHWEVKRLKYLIKEKLMYGANESAESDDESYPRYIRITDIDEDGNLKPDTFRSLRPSVAEPYLLKKGNILFARSGATAGKTYLFNEDIKACFAGYLIKAELQEYIIPNYLNYYTKSGIYENWKKGIFIQATIPNIGADKYANLQITLPPMNEQTIIVQHLNIETNKIEHVINVCRKQISLLQERKQIIINDVVTGKVKVV